MQFASKLFERPRVVACFMMLLASAAAASETSVETGDPVAGVIDAFRSTGLPFVYSSNLLPPTLLVRDPPVSTDPLEIASEILAPHGLAIREEAGYYLIVRAPETDDTRHSESRPTTNNAPEIEVITVSASRYEFSGKRGRASVQVSRRTIETLPDLGDDPVRALQRLPGAAAGGTSAKTHLRGGDENETGIVLNGQRLLDPFHVRDYHSLFSAIDTRAVANMEVYSGGFPVQYGDRMSGMVLIDSLNPEKPRRTELGLSVFSTSALSAGLFDGDDGQWLVSARRGNLDLVLNEDLGEPRYHDFFVELSRALSPDVQLTANGLIADDSVIVATESDVDEHENSRNDARNAQAWLQLENSWSATLESTTAASFGSFDELRIGINDQPDKMLGGVRDRRKIDAWGLRQDWSFQLRDAHRLSWGGQYTNVRAGYAYEAEAEYLDFFAAFESSPESFSRNLAADIDGEIYSVFVSERWDVTGEFAAELGMRWDKQTYTTDPSDEQWSPRLTLYYRIGKKTELRASAGRYYQSQDVHELQIEDGETEFYPAQLADHFIVGLQHYFPSGLAFRSEIYSKRMRRLRPRFENLYDPLAIIPELEPDRVRIAPDRARSEGLELSLSRDAGEGSSWWISYVLSRVDDEIDGRRVPRNWDQRHALQAGFSYSGERWEFSAAARLHSGWPTTRLILDEASTEDDPVLRFGERNAERFGRYATLDLRLSRRFPLRLGSLNAFVEIANATNRNNPCCADHDLEETADGLRLERSEEYWLPLLPAIGILWEF
jgi:hypothetical protein